MQANWSFILNILLLVGVIFAIGRMIKERRANNAPVAPNRSAPTVELNEKNNNLDDIIAVRKISREELSEEEPPKLVPSKPIISAESEPVRNQTAPSIMVFLLARENRQFAGYELLQTLLACGLRFGEGQLFHRHQNPNGQGPVLCSLAAATASGLFDLQNIGAFSVHGLCLFMQPSNHSAIDEERFEVMIETAKQLAEGLDAHLLDDQRKPFSDNSLRRYYNKLNIQCEA